MGAKIVGKFRILYGAKTSKKIARITAEATEKRLVGSIRARKCLKIVPAFFSNFDPSAESERRISGIRRFGFRTLCINYRPSEVGYKVSANNYAAFCKRPQLATIRWGRER